MRERLAQGLARPLRANWLRVLVHGGALVPFALLLWDGAHNRLTANPIQEITFRTGKTALVLLVLSLACTPASALLGSKQAVLVRRPLGLYAFFYAGLHFLTFAVLDYGLDWSLIQQAIVEKRFVLAGFAAFTLLAPLALTSTKGWQRRLGKRWKRLHRLVYAAAALAIVHFVWLVKADVREPLLYGAAVAGLLALRLPPVRRTLARLRRRAAARAGKASPRLPRPVPPLGPSQALGPVAGLGTLVPPRGPVAAREPPGPSDPWSRPSDRWRGGNPGRGPRLGPAAGPAAPAAPSALSDGAPESLGSGAPTPAR